MLALLVSVCLLSGWVADGRPSEEDPDVVPGEVDSFRFELFSYNFSYLTIALQELFLCAARILQETWPACRWVWI